MGAVGVGIGAVPNRTSRNVRDPVATETGHGSDSPIRSRLMSAEWTIIAPLLSGAEAGLGRTIARFSTPS